MPYRVYHRTHIRSRDFEAGLGAVPWSLRWPAGTVELGQRVVSTVESKAVIKAYEALAGAIRRPSSTCV